MNACRNARLLSLYAFPLGIMKAPKRRLYFCINNSDFPDFWQIISPLWGYEKKVTSSVNKSQTRTRYLDGSCQRQNPFWAVNREATLSGPNIGLIIRETHYIPPTNNILHMIYSQLYTPDLYLLNETPLHIYFCFSFIKISCMLLSS